jgi:hypothetical protein
MTPTSSGFASLVAQGVRWKVALIHSSRMYRILNANQFTSTSLFFFESRLNHTGIEWGERTNEATQRTRPLIIHSYTYTRDVLWSQEKVCECKDPPHYAGSVHSFGVHHVLDTRKAEGAVHILTSPHISQAHSKDELTCRSAITHDPLRMGPSGMGKNGIWEQEERFRTPRCGRYVHVVLRTFLFSSNTR